MFSILVSVFVFASSAFGSECDKRITKVMIPMSFDAEQGICFDDYFANRNLSKISISSDDGALFEDAKNMAFDDMLLFSYDKPMGEEGRLNIAKEIYQSYRQSLKDPMGACDIQLWNGDKQLQVTDFQIAKREAEGQPGTRIIIKSEDFKSPSWKLVCKSVLGGENVVKQGKYFFVFVDVYENIGTANLKNHLSQYLFSHRQ